MRPSLPSYLLELQAAIADVRQFTNAKTLADYLSDSMLRAAVERKLTVIGEVLAQMRYHFLSLWNALLTPSRSSISAIF